MKKILSLVLCALMLVSMLALVGCKKDDKKPDENKGAETLKFGVGVSVKATPTNASDAKKASGKLEMTLAAVLVGADGKIAACELDAMNLETTYKDGAVQPVEDKGLTTKYDQGDNYGMSAYGKVEWDKQTDKFLELVPGKTIDEVKAMVVNGYAGNEDVIAAGCTIGVNDFVIAIVNAYDNAKTEVAADAKLSVSGVGEQKVGENQNKLDATMCGAALDADGKVLAITSDAASFTFLFAEDGTVSLKDLKKEGDEKRSKRQMGTDYGMSAYGKQEWNVQADAFDNACVGKTASEIAGLVKEDGYAVDAVYSAGCTITVSGLVKAASKI